MEGAVDSSRTYGKSIDPGTDGRLEIKTPKGSGLKVTTRGLEIDPSAVGEKNLLKLVPIEDLATGATAGNLVVTVNELLQALRDTKRMRVI
jgi:hypothetical protein